MKMLGRACLLAAIAAPGILLADEAAPEAKSLATVETILQYCAKADPSAADQYREQIKLVAQGASEETLAKVRKSEEYQQARDSVVEFLDKVDERNAKKVCSQHLEAGQ